MLPRLTVIADREPFNLEALIEHSNQYPSDFRLSAILAPFNDLDPLIIGLVDRVDGMRQDGIAMPLELDLTSPFRVLELESPFKEVKGNMHFSAPDTSINYIHVPYPKGMSDAQRLVYSLALLEVIKITRPDLVFLSNFKAILDGVIPESYPFKIVNVHPSVLPHNKGWRTEKMALEGTNPEASGYTFHVVVPEIDEGATLFQQKVRTDGHTEESLRLATILAQSMYTPRVLALYASSVDTVIVQGSNAFEAEGRKKPYPNYQNYRRMLFKSEGKFRTMEDIFGAPEFAPDRKLDEIATYTFTLTGSNRDTYSTFGRIITEAQMMGEF